MSSDGDYLYLFAEGDLGGVVQLHWTMLGGEGIGELHVHARNHCHDHLPEWSDELLDERVPEPGNDERINCLTVPVRVRENGDRLSVDFGVDFATDAVDPDIGGPGFGANASSVGIDVRVDADAAGADAGADVAADVAAAELSRSRPSVLGRATMDGELLTMTVLGGGVGTAKLTLRRGSAQDWTRMVADYRDAVRQADHADST